jgi:hypothetical protein
LILVSVAAWGICLACAVGLAALVAWRKTFDTDIYWHLAAGREAVRQHSTLPQDIFSYSAAGTPWRYKELLADVLLYLGFSRLGYAFFALLKGAAALLIGAALYMAVPPGRRHPAAWLFGLSVHLLAVQYRFAERPLLFSLCCFPLMLALCERARRLAEGPWLAAYGPPLLLQLVWVQLHREALLGPVLLMCLFLYQLAAHFLVAAPSRRAVGHAGAAWLCAVLLSLCTPSGLALFTTTFAVAGSAVFKRIVYEWKALPVAEMARLFPATLAVAGVAGLLLAGALVRGARTRRWTGPVSPWLLLLYLGLSYQAGTSIRWLPHLAAVSALVITLFAAELHARLVRLSAWLLALLCAALAPLAVAGTNRYETGIGELPDHFPSGALAFAREHRLHERVANALGLGAYTIWHAWPAHKVLVDGRMDLVYSPAFLLRCQQAQKEAAAFHAMRREDGADWVLAVNRPGIETHLFLADDPGWALVYLSEAAAIYVRRDAYPQLLPLRFRHLRPGALVGSALLALRTAPRAEVEGELRRVLSASQVGLRARTALGLLREEGPR